jgi:hypothetical protein
MTPCTPSSSLHHDDSPESMIMDASDNYYQLPMTPASPEPSSEYETDISPDITNEITTMLRQASDVSIEVSADVSTQTNDENFTKQRPLKLIKSACDLLMAKKTTFRLTDTDLVKILMQFKDEKIALIFLLMNENLQSEWIDQCCDP